MIKVIALDLGGVLVTEKDIELSEKEDQLERFFGKNISDGEYAQMVKHIVSSQEKALLLAREIILKLYEPKDSAIFDKLHQKYPSLTLCIATNHLSFIEEYIEKTFPKEYLAEVFISANMHIAKPDIDFYNYITEKLGYSPKEVLFVDDRIENVEAAQKAQMNGLLIKKDDDVFDKICEYLQPKN